MLDSKGKVVGTSDPQNVVGQLAADPALVDAAHRKPSGPYGREPVFRRGLGARQHLAIVSPACVTRCSASVSGSRKWLPWAIYAPSCSLALGFVALVRGCLRSAQALSSANAELEAATPARELE